MNTDNRLPDGTSAGVAKSCFIGSAMTCSICGLDVDAERAVFISAFQKPEVCIKCSTETHNTVYFEYGHKTAGTAVVVGSDPEQQRLARNCYLRRR